MSSWSTYTKVSALHWYSYYWYLVYHIDKIVSTKQGEYFLYSFTSLKVLCEIVQFLLNTVIIVNLFLGPALRICDHHHNVWVRYIDNTEIIVWCMSSILIHMTYFSVYTICISEHYREIVSYIPIPSQQVSVIL